MFIDCSSWNSNLHAYGIRSVRISTPLLQFWHHELYPSKPHPSHTCARNWSLDIINRSSSSRLAPYLLGRVVQSVDGLNRVQVLCME